MTKPEQEPNTFTQPPKEGIRRVSEPEFNRLRYGFFQDHALSVLSLIKIEGNLKLLARSPRNNQRGHLTGGVALDTFLGINPNDNKQTKDRKGKEFSSNQFNHIVDKLWDEDANQIIVDPKDRQIGQICQDLKQMGKDKEELKAILRKHYGLDIATEDNPNG
ncbi:MAG: hypothetical protein ACD_50C00338G0009 [uncultured bacterium]|nr:MAG: hypothetical protein ACD_50C00338G0009 [uncultured bacterium]OGH13466.1 MAG: hypothetical protein A2687_02155 [Candidatus Levybacteria bacterium RIFCSPHIGHO2_01_FULL_38_26]